MNNQIIHLHNVLVTTMVVIVIEGILKEQGHPLDKNLEHFFSLLFRLNLLAEDHPEQQ